MLPLANIAVTAALSVGKAVAGSLAETAARTADTAKARKTAADFESMFLENALDTVTKSTGTDGPLGENGTGGGVYRSMLTKEYAGQIAKSGGVGIADSVFREILKLQGAGQTAGQPAARAAGGAGASDAGA